MVLTEQVVLAISAAIPPTVAAIGAIIISLRTDKKADVIAKSTEQIEHHVNSGLTDLREELREARVTIAQLNAKLKTSTLYPRIKTGPRK